MTESQTIEKTKKLLIEITQKELENVDKVAICFSGSLDSSIVAFIAKNYTSTKIQLYTIGFENCYDFKQSSIASKLLNLSNYHKKIHLDETSLAPNLTDYLKLTQDNDKVSISYTLPLYILFKEITENHILTGHGADTLFGGFHKYLKAKNLKQTIKLCYAEFIHALPEREYKIAQKFRKNLIIPFANELLSRWVLTWPQDYFIRGNTRKVLLRKIAKNMGLPDELANSPKKAIQYSTGIMKKLIYRTL